MPCPFTCRHLTPDSVSMNDAATTFKEVAQFFVESKTKIRVDYNLACTIQGPQGMCSDICVSAIRILANCLEKLVDKYSLGPTMYPLCISTKVNEYIFSSVRTRIVTPDTLEFCHIFPVVVEDVIMRMAKLPFHYFTRSSSYYERPRDFAVVDRMPTMPSPTKVYISRDNLLQMEDYRKAYLEGVRQQNIRGQTTKDKVSTLPLYAYIEPPPEPLCFDFKTMLDIQATDIPPAPTTRWPKGSVFSLTDKRIGVVVNDFTTADKLVTFSMYHNDNQDPLSMVKTGIEHLPEEVVCQNLDLTIISGTDVFLLNEYQYEGIFGVTTIDREADEDTDGDDDIIPETNNVSEYTTTSRGRKRRAPTFLQDYEF